MSAKDIMNAMDLLDEDLVLEAKEPFVRKRFSPRKIFLFVAVIALLGTLTRRRSLDRYDALTAQKRGGGQVEIALEELAECASSQDVQAQAEASELAERIGAFLRTVPATDRRVFVCRYWYFDPIEAIAEQFGFSKSKVRSMLHRTRGKLRKYLEKEGIEV